MSTELVQSGLTFKIRNTKSGTVMDLSGADNRSIIGYPDHNGTNQQWTTDWTSIGWTFRAKSSGLYLAPDGSASDGTRLVAVTTPFGWDIWHDDVDPSTYRIFDPLTHYNLDLYNYGDPTPGTPITLWTAWNGIHQTWRFELV